MNEILKHDEGYIVVYMLVFPESVKIIQNLPVGLFEGLFFGLVEYRFHTFDGVFRFVLAFFTFPASSWRQ